MVPSAIWPEQALSHAPHRGGARLRRSLVFRAAGRSALRPASPGLPAGLPDFVSGVSIGAINAAIIAGNPPAQRLNKLRAFWEMITDRKIWPFTPAAPAPLRM